MKSQMHYAILILFFIGSVIAITAAVDCPPSGGMTFLPHPNCSMYYLCVNGVALEQQCPPGTLFNPRVNECDFPINVPECEGGTRPPEGSTTIGPTDEPSTYETTLGTPAVPTTQEPQPTTTVEPEQIIKRCGDTFEGISGAIEYKLDTVYNGGELCPFILKFPTDDGILFTLEESGIEAPAFGNWLGAIAIFTFGENGLLDTAHLGPPNPFNSTYLSGSLAVVVFNSPAGFSGSRPTGFRLSFEGLGLASPTPNPFDSFSTDTAHLGGSYKYPPDNSTYANKLQAIFVISNKYEVIYDGIREHVQVNITQSDIEHDSSCFDESLDCTCDFLNVYSFKGGDESLILQERFCDAEKHQTVFQAKGIIIMYLYSDSLGSGNGISLDWGIKYGEEP